MFFFIKETQYEISKSISHIFLFTCAMRCLSTKIEIEEHIRHDFYVWKEYTSFHRQSNTRTSGTKHIFVLTLHIHSWWIKMYCFWWYSKKKLTIKVDSIGFIRTFTLIFCTFYVSQLSHLPTLLSFTLIPSIHTHCFCCYFISM